MPPQTAVIIDLFENSDYYLNGYCVKNPIYIAKFERVFLPEHKTNNKNKFFKINQKNVYLEDCNGNYILD